MKTRIFIFFLVLLMFSCSNQQQYEQFDCTSFDEPKYCEISNKLLLGDISQCQGDDLCIAYFGVKSNNYEICEDLSGLAKEVCYQGIMYNTMDFEKCKEMIESDEEFQEATKVIGVGCQRLILSQNIHRKDTCEIGLEKAKKLGSPEAINYNFYVLKPKESLITWDEWMKECKIMMNQFDTEETMESCELKLDIEKDICYMNVAVSTNNIEICKKIEHDAILRTCHFEFAYRTKDIAMCPKTESHPACVSRILGMTS